MNAVERSSAKAANALGGKTARACENCLIKRARWFCSADEAFLCQACDTSVHSANLLASKHERFRLETSSYSIDHHHHDALNSNSSSPSWHQGFTKKARTPRQPKSSRTSWSSQLQPSNNPIDPVVPEINSEEYPFNEECEEQSACRVPVFYPSFDDHEFSAKFGEEGTVIGGGGDHDIDIDELFSACEVDFTEDITVDNNMLEDNSNMLADDNYLGKDLGLGRHFEWEEDGIEGQRGEFKVEEDDDDGSDEIQAAIACHFDPALDMDLNWDFNCNANPVTCDQEIIKAETVLDESMKSSSSRRDHSRIVNNSIDQSKEYDKRRNMLLSLDCEAVIAAWARQDSPWVDGVRPLHFNIEEFMVTCLGGIGVRSGPSDAEREARVSRYREKRRTRLFSKKIRYQVRKLNAEKRPRIKGRFVKRSTMTAFSGISFPYSFMNK